MFPSKVEKEKIRIKCKKNEIVGGTSLILGIPSFISAIVVLVKYDSSIGYFSLFALAIILGVVGTYILHNADDANIYVKDEMEDYMTYFCKLNPDVKDYIVDEEKQTVFLKKNSSLFKGPKNDIIEEVSIDYIVEKAKWLKNKEEAEAKQVQVYQGDFNKLKEVKKQKSPEVKSIEEEIFNTLKEKAKVKENKINKTGKKVYL